MRLFSPTIYGAVVLLCCLVAAHSNAQPADAPVYSRQRGTGAWEAGTRGDVGQRGNARHRGMGAGSLPMAGRYAGFDRGFYRRQPIVAGSWYTRPYPYHFDYYRQQYSAPPQTTDCPCASAPWQD